MTTSNAAMTSTEKMTLLPCPFCGNEQVRLTTNNQAAMSWVACPNCGLEAPSETGVNADDAVTYWNRRSLSEGQKPVAVKGLEWHGPDIRDEFTARSMLGQFVIGPKQRNGSRWCMGDYHLTIEDAKASAQADYEARILSALVTPPAEPARAELAGLTEAQIEHMVNRFLGWRLPESFNPDNGITFDPRGNAGNSTYEYTRRPTGTNLFDATQAKAMVRHMIEGLFTTTPPAAAKDDTSQREGLIGQMRVCAEIARSSPDDFTYLNGPAREMLRKAVAALSLPAGPVPEQEGEG
jgi:Lar family restriction alleviation protein